MQDQCGGLYPGFKWSQSDKCLPLRVHTQVLPVSPESSALLASHLVLVYTGKARLAKTLLYDVLRRWHMRVPQVVDNLSALQATAEVTPPRKDHSSSAQPIPRSLICSLHCLRGVGMEMSFRPKRHGERHPLRISLSCPPVDFPSTAGKFAGAALEQVEHTCRIEKS